MSLESAMPSINYIAFTNPDGSLAWWPSFPSKSFLDANIPIKSLDFSCNVATSAPSVSVETTEQENEMAENQHQEDKYYVISGGIINKQSEISVADDIEDSDHINEYLLVPAGSMSDYIAFSAETKEDVDVVAARLLERFPDKPVKVSVSVAGTHGKIFRVFGEYILNTQPSIKFKGDPWAFASKHTHVCPPGKIFDPESGKCVKIDKAQKKPLRQEDMKGNLVSNINNLPDTAFAVVEAGKQEKLNGKIFTIPRTFRHLPHHTDAVRNGNENDTIDVARFRNAIARRTQIKAQSPTSHTSALIKAAENHLRRHARVILPDSVIMRANTLGIDVLNLARFYFTEINNEN